MMCAHCGMACTAKGRHMSFKTAQKAINAAFNNEHKVILGGGEPTLHPQFWKIMFYALSKTNALNALAPVHIVTNGSVKNSAIKLALMAKYGEIGCVLSLDKYHRPIDPEVIKYFTDKKICVETPDPEGSEYPYILVNDRRSIHNSEGREVIGGRQLWGKATCMCKDLFVQPNGTIKQCGCLNAPVIGNINQIDATFKQYQHTCHNRY